MNMLCSIAASDSAPICVDIVQPRVAHYRVPLFNALLGDSRFDISIQASKCFMGNRSAGNLPAGYDLNHPVTRVPWTNITWQHRMRLKKVCRRGDVLMVCGDLHTLSTVKLLLNARRRGIGILWWGHHLSAGGRAYRVALRLLLTRWLSDCVLCYTEEGKKYLIRKGFYPARVFAAGNTLDCSTIKKECESWNRINLAIFKKERRLHGRPVLLFCGVIRKKTRLEILLNALAERTLIGQSWNLVVIGDGEMKQHYCELADRLSIADRVRWIGPCYDESQLAPYFLSASYFVYPGSIGLSLIHSFGYGLPVIAHDNRSNHGPEVEALSPGHNGLLFREGDVSNLCSVLGKALQDVKLQNTLSRNAWQTAHNTYSMNAMVINVKNAIIQCSRVSRKV